MEEKGRRMSDGDGVEIAVQKPLVVIRIGSYMCQMYIYPKTCKDKSGNPGWDHGSELMIFAYGSIKTLDELL
jgi:hypothetical protein